VALNGPKENLRGDYHKQAKSKKRIQPLEGSGKVQHLETWSTKLSAEATGLRKERQLAGEDKGKETRRESTEGENRRKPLGEV